jgi:heat shock protein HtpX
MPAEHPSLWWRLMLALVLMVGFYVLALAIAGALLYLPYAEYKYGRMLHLKLAFLCLLGAGGILWAVLPRFDRFQAPGPGLEPEQHPRLFQEISGVAKAVDQAMPVEVYLVPEVNAWVTNRGGIMGLGSRRVMGLGLPLLQVLSVSELRAVMVHEFGHYHGGDTALAPWVYKTRSAIFRTLDQLKQSLLQKPFVWYAKLFLRLTNAVARKQEYAADALAAEVVGPGPMITGLKKLYQAGLAFETYWGSELAPLLSLGFRPPLAEGFGAFLHAPEVSFGMQEALTQEMETSDANPYDTHPSLKDRITVLDKLPVQTMPLDDQPGLTLIDNLAILEKELLMVLFGEEQAREFQEISWKDTVARVYLPGWREAVRDHAKALSGLRLGELPDLVEHPEEFLSRFDFSPELSLEEKEAPVSIIMGAAVAAALAEQGCQITNELGEPIKVLVAGEWIAPFSLMADLHTEAALGSHWKELCSRAGLSELDLGVIKEGNEA